MMIVEKNTKNDNDIRAFKRNRTDHNRIQWKHAREIAKISFTKAKELELRNYLSSMVIGTPMSKIYEKIRGKRARKINILKTGETLYGSIISIANCPADSFAAVASTSNYSDEFSRVKRAAESIDIPFVSDNNEE